LNNLEHVDQDKMLTEGRLINVVMILKGRGFVRVEYVAMKKIQTIPAVDQGAGRELLYEGAAL
jgi:hypothetical protein